MTSNQMFKITWRVSGFQLEVLSGTTGASSDQSEKSPLLAPVTASRTPPLWIPVSAHGPSWKVKLFCKVQYLQEKKQAKQTSISGKRCPCKRH